MTQPLSFLKTSHLRMARPTDRLDEVVRFYKDCLGFEVLSNFQDHSGFDGVMLGHRGSGYHLEFTTAAGHSIGDCPSKDHLLVFYVPDELQWQAVINSIEAAGAVAVAAFNPYWDLHGKTFADPDGYRVVIQNATWAE